MSSLVEETRQSLKRLLEAAHQTEYYSTQSTHPLEIASLKPVELPEFYSQCRRFRFPGAPPPRPAEMQGPWPGSPQVTVLCPWFPITGNVSVVYSLGTRAVPGLQAVAGPVKQLRELAAAAEQKQWTTPPLEYGLIAFAGLSRPLLTEADRDRLWKAFGVPVFVQFRGFLGELLAMECDCHDGLHVRNGAIWENRTEGRSELLLTSLDNLRYPALRLATRIQGLVDEAPCACGLHSPRLRHLQPMGAATAAHNAAAA